MIHPVPTPRTIPGYVSQDDICSTVARTEDDGEPVQKLDLGVHLLVVRLSQDRQPVTNPHLDEQFGRSCCGCQHKSTRRYSRERAHRAIGDRVR